MAYHAGHRTVQANANVDIATYAAEGISEIEAFLAETALVSA